MTEKRLSDALKVTESPQPNKPNDHKLVKQLAFGAIGVAAIASIGAGIVSTQQADTDKNKDSDTSDTIKEKYEDVFKSVSKDKQKQVESADKAVQKLVEDELNGKKDVHDANIKAAEDAIAGINGDSDDLKSIHDAYTNIVNVVKSPTIDNLQNMRTSIANMSDSNISRHLNDTIESDMIKHVAEKTNKTVKDVTLASKPLTPQQVKTREVESKKKAAAAQKAKADAEKAAAEKAAAEKAKADAAAAEAAKQAAAAAEAAKQAAAAEAQRQAEAAAAQQASNQQAYAEAPQQNYEAPSNGGGYTPPAQNNGGSNYTPPAAAQPSNPAPTQPSNGAGSAWTPSNSNGASVSDSPGGWDTDWEWQN